MNTTDDQVNSDVACISEIPFLPKLLEVVCLATGMGFAAVVRMTEDRWVVGAVEDNIQVGLTPGSELPIVTALCNEMRANKTPVIIDYVAHDVSYCDNLTLAQSGLQSYISFPILKSDGSYFGSLLAVDSLAASLKTPVITELFTMLSSLIALYLDDKQTLPAESVSKLEKYATTELENTKRDIEEDRGYESSTSFSKIHASMLAARLKLLLISFNPDGPFLRR